MTHDDVVNKIIEWNVRFPYDRRWRKKYNIAFNSPNHKESSFLDQLFDLEEDKLFDKLSSDNYIPNSGDWLNCKNSDSSFEDEIKRFNEEFSEE